MSLNISVIWKPTSTLWSIRETSPYIEVRHKSNVLVDFDEIPGEFSLRGEDQSSRKVLAD